MIYDSAVGVLTANTSCARICALIVKTCLLQGAVAIMHAIKLTKRRWTNVAFLATAYGLIGFGISFTISMLSARFGDTRIKYFRIVWRRWKRNWRALYSKMPFERKNSFLVKRTIINFRANLEWISTVGFLTSADCKMVDYWAFGIDSTSTFARILASFVKTSFISFTFWTENAFGSTPRLGIA